METAWWQRLRKLADQHGDHHQQDIATRLGVSNAAVTGWKQGVLPTWQNILNAAVVYGDDPHALLVTAIPQFSPRKAEASLLGLFSHRGEG
jgi:transcriptional regulator with XRE-family HTH domain